MSAGLSADGWAPNKIARRAPPATVTIDEVAAALGVHRTESEVTDA